MEKEATSLYRNVTDACQIGFIESGGVRYAPADILEVTRPSRSSAPLAYISIMSTDNFATYSVISGATSSTYDPGVITQTTWDKRCVKRSNRTTRVESNIIKKEVTSCCSNVTDADKIGYKESLCGSYNPANIVNVTSPSGGSVTLD